MGSAGYAFAGLSLVGAGVQAYGQYEAGKTNEALGNWNASVNDMRARDAIVQGENAVTDTKTQATVFQGAQRAAIAGQGIDVGNGTALKLLSDTENKTRREVNRIRADAAREAWGFKVAGENDRMGARFAGRAGRVGAAGTILTGVAQSGQMANQKYREG